MPPIFGGKISTRAPPPQISEMDAVPVACKALQRNLHRLATAIDPVVISTELYSAEVINERAWEDARKEINGPNYDRSLTVLGAVLRAVKANPDFFETFCGMLEQHNTTQKLASELKGEVKRLQKKKRCDEGEPSPSNRNHNGGELETVGDEEEDPLPPCARKQRLAIRTGKIQDADRLLKDVALEIGDKWEEVGIELSISYKVLKSVIGSEVHKSDHTKAFHMLQEWKDRAGEKFSYQTLATALEGCGLNTAAQQYCYSICTQNEQ